MTMITPEYASLMARYNQWQNENLLNASETLDPSMRIENRGAFFGSLLGTFSHILWADMAWLNRFGACDPPPTPFGESSTAYPEWNGFVIARRMMDEKIKAWAESLTTDDIDGGFEFYSSSTQETIKMSNAVAIMQLFNHAVHHRGQAHALLTGAGAEPGVTDLPFLPSGLS